MLRKTAICWVLQKSLYSGGGFTFEGIYLRLLCQDVFGIQDRSTEVREDDRNCTESRLSRSKLDLIRVRISRNRHYSFRRGKATFTQSMYIISRGRQ